MKFNLKEDKNLHMLHKIYDIPFKFNIRWHIFNSFAPFTHTLQNCSTMCEASGAAEMYR